MEFIESPIYVKLSDEERNSLQVEESVSDGFRRPARMPYVPRSL